MPVPKSVKKALTIIGLTASGLLVLWLVGVGILLVVLRLTIGDCDHMEYYRYTGPDGSKDAVIFERSCGIRGAFRVAVVPKGEKKLSLDRSVHMASYRDFNPMSSTVRWRDPRSLAVCAGPGKPPIDEARIDGVSVFAGCDEE